MDLRSTLLLTTKGSVEANNKRSPLDFKSRSILTSLRNQEKTLAELLSRIFIENKEAMVLVNGLLNDGYITTDPTLSHAAENAAAEEEAARLAANALSEKLAAERAAEDERERARAEQERLVEASKERARAEAAAAEKAEKARAEAEEQAIREEATRRARELAETERIQQEALSAEKERERSNEESARLAEEQRQFRERERQAEETRRSLELQRNKIESQRIAEELRKKADEALALRKAADEERKRLAAENHKKAELAEKIRIESEAKARAKAEQEEIARLEAEVRAEAEAVAERARLAEAARVAKIKEQEQQLLRDEQWRRDQSAARMSGVSSGKDDSPRQTQARERLREIAAVGGVIATEEEQKRFLEAARKAHAERIGGRGPGPIQAEVPFLSDLTSSDTIDIIGEAEDESQVSPKLGRSLRPSLSRFIPGILRVQGDPAEQSEDSNRDITPKPRAPRPTALISESVSQSRTVPESITSTGSVKPKIILQPVVSKVHTAHAKQRESLVRPAIVTKPSDPGAMQSLLSSAGGAGKDFLTSFNKVNTTGTQTNAGRPSKTKPILRPVSVAATKALTIIQSTKVSDGIFTLSDFCIDHLGVKAAEYIDQLERSRDLKSLQAVVSEIFASINPKEKDKISALFSAVEALNKAV